MAEKKVSVRLVAEGGRRVRAELEGVGEAGARGLGRLSREMELANTSLAAFARRAGLALGAAAAAATASLGLIVRSTAESAAQIRQFAQVANSTPDALQRWSAGARTVGIEQEKLADILKDVNDRVGDFLQTGGGPMADFFENVAPRVGVTADQFARLSGPEALQLYVDTLERAGLSQQEMTFYLEAMASDATRLLPLLRNGGAEMARLGDQASELGAVLDSDALQALRRTQLALGTVSLVFDGLRNRIAVAVAPTIEALANAFVALASEGGVLRSAIDTLIGNLGRFASYAATFAAVMAGRWVAGLAAAALSVRGLATALVFLRGALIRTGIGALIVGAGELVYQFSQLVARVNLLTTFGSRARIGTLAFDFFPGPTSRFDLGNTLIVDLLSGTLESVTDVALFGGANALAVETAAGVWEIVQAGQAELIAPGRYRLTRLLRGQRGTEHAMGNPAPAGARVVVLDATLASLPIAEADLSLPWNWRVGPAARAVSDASYAALGFTPTGRGLVPFAPVHVEQPWRTARSPGDLTIRWTRRSRALVADAWEQVEVPLAEELESYDIQILDGAAIKRTLTSATTSVLYTAAQQTADWGAPLGPGQTLAIRIYQLSNRLGRGMPASVTLQF